MRPIVVRKDHGSPRSVVKFFLTTREAEWYIISVMSLWMYGCVSVCWTITFERLDVVSSCSHIRYISRKYG